MDALRSAAVHNCSVLLSGIEGVKGDSIDSANPVTKEDFDKFSECLKEKLQQYEVCFAFSFFVNVILHFYTLHFYKVYTYIDR